MKKIYQTGGFLPELEFAKIRQAVVPQPIEEFGALTGALNERFDTGQKLLEDQIAAATALETAPLEVDREKGRILKEDALAKLDAIKQQGDFENQVVNVRRAATDFNQQAIPLIQRQQEFNKFVEDVQSRKDISGANKQRIIKSAIAEVNADPTSLTTDLDTGITLNNLNRENFQGLVTGDVNATDIFQKAASGVKSKLTKRFGKRVKEITTDDQGNTIAVMWDQTKERIDPNEMAEVLDQEMANNQQLKAFLEREERIAKDLGEEFTAQDEVLAARDAVLGARSGLTKDLENFRFVPGTSTAGRGTDQMIDAVVRTNSTPAFKVNSTEDYSNLLTTINNYRNSNDPKLQNIANNLQQSVDTFTSQVLKDFTEDERKLYNIALKNQIQKSKKSISQLAGEAQLGFATALSDMDDFKEDLQQAGITEKYTLGDANRIYEQVQKSIENSIENISPLSRSYTSFSAGDSGLGKAFTGKHNTILNQDLDSQNYSILTGFGTDTGGSWKEYYKKNYVENDEFEGYTDIRFEGRNTNGLDVSGSPFNTITILGKDKNGKEVILGSENVKESDSDQAWKNREKLGLALQRDGLFQEAAFIRQQTERLSNGDRLGSVIARTNVIGMPINSKRSLNLGNHGNLEVRKNQNGNVYLYTENGNVFKDESGQPIEYSDDSKLMSDIFFMINPQQ
jgi:hypothetical protein